MPRKQEKKITAWHFVAEDKKLRYGSGMEVEPGYIYTEDEGKIALCYNGMHASKTVYDALYYAPGPWLCRVRIWGDVVDGGGKLAGRHREVLQMVNVDNELRLWGCWCVRQVWNMLTDDRSKRAVEVAEAFARGEATREQLTAASTAAGDAARDAARDAANAAVWAAAWAVVWAVVWVAAWDTAWVAARDTASGAASGASWAAQSQELERRMLVLFGENDGQEKETA